MKRKLKVSRETLRQLDSTQMAAIGLGIETQLSACLLSVFSICICGGPTFYCSTIE